MYRHWGSVQAVRPIEEVEVELYSFLTTALEGVRGQCHAPAALYPREKPGTHCTEGWVGPRVGLDRCGKSRPHRVSIPRPSSPQPVAISTELPGPQSFSKTIIIIHSLYMPVQATSFLTSINLYVVEERMAWEWTLNKYVVRGWIGCIWLCVESSNHLVKAS